jgi:undecaprenyl-diphosphatase
MTPRLRFLGLVVTTLVLSAIAAGDTVVPGDVAIATTVQAGIPPVADGVVAVINELGEGYPGILVVTLLLAAILNLRGCQTMAILMLATLPMRLANFGLKTLFASPRPTADAVDILNQADGFGFPSGHATGAMLVFGAVIVATPCLADSPGCRVAVRLVAILLILIAGASRIEVGAHWPSDVLGGYLWGAVMLAMLVSVTHRSRPPGRVVRQRARADRAAGTSD